MSGGLNDMALIHTCLANNLEESRPPSSPPFLSSFVYPVCCKHTCVCVCPTTKNITSVKSSSKHQNYVMCSHDLAHFICEGVVFVPCLHSSTAHSPLKYYHEDSCIVGYITIFMLWSFRGTLCPAPK